MTGMALRRARVTFALVAVVAGIALAAVLGLALVSGGRGVPVILISIDTCRADYLGCYNPERPLTPNIDAVAAEGTRFARAVAPIPVTLPSHTSMLTGRIPPAHGLHDNGLRVPAGVSTLAELLSAEGYTTGAFVSSAVLARQFGLDQGFATYNDAMSRVGEQLTERRAEQTTDAAIEWLRTHQDDDQVFLLVHYYDPHAPYDPPAPFAGRYDDPYAGEVAYTDAQIGRLLEALRQFELYDEALLIVTADHGEMLGEHGEQEHRYFIYQSAVHVPLIVKLPGQEAPRVVQDIVGLVDILPTVCSITDLPTPDGVTGRDLSAYLSGDDAGDMSDRHIYCESVYPQFTFGANPLLGLVGNRWKLIDTTVPELYDLHADPDELSNLHDTQPERARALRQQLQAVLTRSGELAIADDAPMDDQTRRLLSSLGYVGGARPTSLAIEEGRDNPADLIGIYEAFQEAKMLDQLGQRDQAIERMRELIEQRPNSARIRIELGRALTGAGQLAEALEHLNEAVELTEGAADAHFARGMTAVELGQWDLAQSDLETAIRLDPGSNAIYSALAKVYHATEQVERAEEAYLASLKLEDRNLSVLAGLARLYVDALDAPDQAIGYAERAVLLQPQNPILLDIYGWSLARNGQHGMAREILTRALQIAPLPSIHYHLGWSLEQQGAVADARGHYQQALDLLPGEGEEAFRQAIGEALERVRGE